MRNALPVAAVLLWVFAIPAPAAQPIHGVVAGVELLREDGFAALRGLRTAVVVNASSVDARGRHTLEVLAEASDLDWVRAVVFPPLPPAETIERARARCAISIWDRPLADTAWRNLDVVVFDARGMGVRDAAAERALRLVLRAALSHGFRVMVLDRPSVLGHPRPRGPILADTSAPRCAVPWLHGLTLGELARHVITSETLEIDLTVRCMRGWRRGMAAAHAGLGPGGVEPDVTTREQADLYPATALLEQLGCASAGQGTHRAYTVAGGIGLDALAIARTLRQAPLPGVRASPTTFRPARGPWADQRCQGVRLRTEADHELEPIRLAAHLLVAFPACTDNATAGEVTALFDALRGGQHPDDAVMALDRHPAVTAYRAAIERLNLYAPLRAVEPR